jgi:hypothetical protein
MLAVAIALNVTVFTVVQAMLFRGLPLAERSDRLAYIQIRPPGGPWGASWDDFERWRSEVRAFEGVGYFGEGRIETLRHDYGQGVETIVPRVTVNTFGLLGVRPMLGRDFTPADEAAAAAPVVILSHRFWSTR